MLMKSSEKLFISVANTRIRRLKSCTPSRLGLQLTHCSSNQRVGNVSAHRVDGLSFGFNLLEGTEDAPYCSEQTDKRSGRSGRGQWWCFAPAGCVLLYSRVSARPMLSSPVMPAGFAFALVGTQSTEFLVAGPNT